MNKSSNISTAALPPFSVLRLRMPICVGMHVAAQAVGTADFAISGCAKVVLCCTESATRHKHLLNKVSRRTPIVVGVSKQSDTYMYVCVHTYILLAARKVGSHK